MRSKGKRNQVRWKNNEILNQGVQFFREILKNEEKNIKTTSSH